MILTYWKKKVKMILKTMMKLIDPTKMVIKRKGLKKWKTKDDTKILEEKAYITNIFRENDNIDIIAATP